MDTWQISETLEFITKHNATKIALQFPDHLLKESSSIAVSLKEKLNSNNNELEYQVYIMADTTFAPCCVDEISAQHVNAHVIIHYGWSCCSPTKRIPTFHVLAQKTFDIQLLHQLLFAPKTFTQMFNSFKKILILYEPHYNHYRDTLIQLFKHKDVEFIITQIHNKSSNKNENDDESKSENETSHFCGFYYDSLLDKKQWNKLLQSDDFSIDTIKQTYAVLYIGNDESQYQLYLSSLTNFGSCFKFISYNPHTQLFNIKKHETLLSKILIYRYSLIEKIRNSNIIGIVCSTLSVPHYLDIIKTLKQTIKKSGKKPYLLSISKPNQAKFGNFSEIDIFVIITCSMSFQYLLPIQQESFFKPLVTPFDVMLALNANINESVQSFKWTGMYSTDFDDILQHSFKMGGIKYENVTQKNQCNDKTIAISGKSGALIKNATHYMLQKRSWKGLEITSEDIAPSEIEQGLDGIASKYEGE